MILTAIISGFSSLVGFATSWLPQVSELPFGMHNAFLIFSGSLAAILELMPWLQIVWHLFLLAVTIRTALLSWEFFKWFMSLIRG